MRSTIVAAVLAVALSTSHAHAAPRFTCEQVRWAVKQFGKRTLEIMGKTYGVTPEEREFARKCMGSK